MPVNGSVDLPLTNQGIQSINADTTAAQVIAAGSGISVGTVAGTTTITATGGSFTAGNLTDAGTDGITVTGGTNAVNGSGTSIAQHVADTTHNGYLSSTDWNTFNGKAAYPTNVNVSSNVTLTVNAFHFVSTAAAHSLALPTPASAVGKPIWIKDITGTASTNNITITRNGSEQIEGVAASKTLQTDFGAWMIVSDGTNWWIL